MTAAESWIKQNPNTFMAFYRAIVAASLYVSDKNNRAGMAKVLSQPQYINAPEIVVDQVIIRALRRRPREYQNGRRSRRLSALPSIFCGGMADGAIAAMEYAQGRHRL